jgi:uncharacterized glyoxalase superfamily protein PhnB
VVALQCHDDVRVCAQCIGWLRSKAGIIDSTPVLPVLHMAASVAFYRNAGFEVREYDGGGFAFVSHEDESVFDLDQGEVPMTIETNGAGCYLIVPDVESWHGRLSESGLPVTALTDQPWGMREFTLTDPSGNRIRFGHTLAG